MVPQSRSGGRHSLESEDLAGSVFEAVVSVLGKPGSLQRDGNVAEQKHIEIPPEVFRLDRYRRYEVGLRAQGLRKIDQWREGLYRTRLQELGCIFPANVDPRITCSNWAGRMEKLQQRGEQLGADCSTDRAVLLLGEAARGTEYGGWTGMGGGGVAVFWVVAQHLGVEEVEVQKLGEPPKCGESDRAKGSKLPPMGIQRSPRNPGLCTSNCQVVKLAIAQISRRY